MPKIDMPQKRSPFYSATGIGKIPTERFGVISNSVLIWQIWLCKCLKRFLKTEHFEMKANSIMQHLNTA